MKINRQKLIVLNRVFDKYSQMETNSLFLYALLKNKRIIVPELELLEQIRVPKEDFNEYNNKRVELGKKYCILGEDGEPDAPDDVFQWEEGKQDEFTEALKPLQEEYADAIAKRDDQEKEFFELLNGDADLNLVQFKLKQLPSEMLGAEVDVLMDLIEE